jgi:hypothetical protein
MRTYANRPMPGPETSGVTRQCLITLCTALAELLGYLRGAAIDGHSPACQARS